MNRIVQSVCVAFFSATAILALADEGDKIVQPPRLATLGPKLPVVQPPPREELEGAIQRGVEFLLRRQNKNGSWGSADSTRPDEIYAPVPGAHQGFRAAVTAMCLSALLEVGGKSPEVRASLERGEAWLLEHLPAVRRATPDTFYNTWAHAYAIQALVRLLDYHPDDPARQNRLRALLRQQIDMLQRYEVIDGGWAYYDFVAQTRKPSGSSISFVTATVLVAFYEAQQIGEEIPEHLVRRGVDSILRQRNPDYSYHYGEYLKNVPRRSINRPAGSLGRSQACNLALRLWGDKTITDDVLKTWLDRLFARSGWFDIGRKRPIPHESWFAISGYFFYYGFYYAALCIEQLPSAERAPYQDQLARLLINLQEKDGSWWDFPMYDYHQQYGTAYALMSLQRCRRGAVTSSQ